MKVNVKKALATLMAATLIVTSGQCPTASAAKKPALNSKKVTLKVGQKKTLKVKNKIKGSTYKWKSSKVKVAKVTKKGVVKALKAGTATITCKVKTKATKKKKAKTYTLKCKVTVKKKTKPKPTAKPTAKPTQKPSDVPSDNPVTPTQAPSDNPSNVPSTEPSAAPSADPSASPSVSPSASPSASPTATPGGGGGSSYRPNPSKPNGDVTVTDGVATVANQTQLNNALKNASVTTLKIVTNASETITIAEGSYTSMDVIVNAPNAHIENAATFKSVTIEAIGDNTWVEKVSNKIAINAKEKAHVVLAKGAKPVISIDRPAGASANPKITITVDGGAAEKINVNAIIDLDIKKGTNAAEASDAKVSVNVTIGTDAEGKGEGAKVNVTSAVQVAITTETVVNVGVTLTDSAGGSTVDVKTASAGGSKVSVTNNTEGTVTLTSATNDGKGKTENVSAGQTGEAIVIADAAKAAIETVKAGLTPDKIKGENESLEAVKLPLNLLATSDAYGLSATGAAIAWSVPEGTKALVIAKSGDTYTTTIVPQDTDVTVVLTAAITLGAATGEKEFKIKIPKKESAAADKTVTIELSAVDYTVATSSSVTASGSSIKVTADATVKEGTTVSTAKATLTYALSTSSTEAPSTFDTNLELDLSDTTKYLWIKATVTVNGETVTEYFVSNDTVDPGAGKTGFAVKTASIS